MTTRVLIIGGYGNFGSYIARRLARESSVELVIGGRSKAKAQAFAASLDAANCASAITIDISGDVLPMLADTAPALVIHTVGPFQSQDYRVARACIAVGADYVDLADARAFVTGIAALEDRAKAADRAIISGASSVPCLSAAIVDHYLPKFARLEAVRFGITAAQQTNRGLATASSILSYVGKPFSALDHGRLTQLFGWQGLHSIDYPLLGRRWFGNCDIPDLDLFPQRYPTLRTVRFGAGHEIAPLHFAIWSLSGLVRGHLLPRLDRFAPLLLKGSFLFDRLGTSSSGMHVVLSGTDQNGGPRTVRHFLIARRGHGPYIPCMPAIILAKRIAAGQGPAPGARPCLDLIDLHTYMAALEGLDIEVFVEGADA